MLLLLLALFATEALPKAGPAVVGSEAPWFSGWTPENQVLNRDTLSARFPEARGFALVVFQTTCKPCEKGLLAMRDGAAKLDAAKVEPVLVALREEAKVVQPWLKARGLGGQVLVLDRFGVATAALGATARGRKGTAVLPHTVVMDAQRVVRAIFGTEGSDYIERVIAALPKP